MKPRGSVLAAFSGRRPSCSGAPRLRFQPAAQRRSAAVRADLPGGSGRPPGSAWRARLSLGWASSDEPHGPERRLSAGPGRPRCGRRRRAGACGDRCSPRRARATPPSWWPRGLARLRNAFAVPVEPGVLHDEVAEPRLGEQWPGDASAPCSAGRSISSICTGSISAAYIPEDLPDTGHAAYEAGFYPPGFLSMRRRYSGCMAYLGEPARGAPAGARLLPPIPNGVSCRGACRPARQARFRPVPRTDLSREGRPSRDGCGGAAECPLIVAGQVFRYDAA